MDHPLPFEQKLNRCLSPGQSYVGDTLERRHIKLGGVGHSERESKHEGLVQETWRIRPVQENRMRGAKAEPGDGWRSSRFLIGV